MRDEADKREGEGCRLTKGEGCSEGEHTHNATRTAHQKIGPISRHGTDEAEGR